MKEWIMSLIHTVWIFLKKRSWYIILLIMSSTYVYYYRNEIYQLEKLNTQNLIFLLWLILLLFPLFSEFEFLGVKIKKEVERANTELKGKVEGIETQITELRISNSVANNIQIGYDKLPTEEKLSELLQSVLQNQNTSSDNITKNTEQKIEDTAVYLFKIRLGIEKMLTEIEEKAGCFDRVYARRGSLSYTTRKLLEIEMIDNVTAELIFQVVKIANRGVHGEIISDDYIDFVQTAYPEIQHNLKKVLNDLSYNK